MAGSGIMSGNAWRSAFRLADFMAADVAVVTGQWNKLGEFQIDPGQIIALGYGELAGQQDASGRIFADFRDNTAAPGANFDGIVQIAIYDANDHPMMILDEYRTEQLRTSSSDRREQIALPFNNTYASQYKKYVLFFKPDAAGTISHTNSKLMLDTTISVGQ